MTSANIAPAANAKEIASRELTLSTNTKGDPGPERLRGAGHPAARQLSAG